MRAAIADRYGPPEVMEVIEADDPRPGRDQVLVRVTAAAVTSGDARIRAARFPPGFGAVARMAFGLRRPRRPILGGTFAGVIEPTGERVAGMTGMAMGTHAELVAVDAVRAVPIPDGVSDDDAAGVLFGGTTARHFLRRAEVGPGQRVLVNGAAGAVGTNAVQLARHLGATVTGVCRGANAELVERLGAEHVIDHTTTDLGVISDRFDVVFDAVGNLSVARGRRLLTPGGRLVLAVAGLRDTVLRRRNVLTGASGERPEDIAALLGLVARGELRVVLDETYDLAEIVDAHRRVDTGRKVGNLIVRP